MELKDKSGVSEDFRTKTAPGLLRAKKGVTLVMVETVNLNLLKGPFYSVYLITIKNLISSQLIFPQSRLVVD